MSSPLEISGLQKIIVKPLAWRVVEHMDSTYTLEFTHLKPERDEWAEIRTRRGKIKHYKTMNAVISDIKRVQDQAVLFMDLLSN